MSSKDLKRLSVKLASGFEGCTGGDSSCLPPKLMRNEFESD